MSINKIAEFYPPPKPQLQTFTDAQINNARSSGTILRISIELTRQCNLACDYCYALVSPSTNDNALSLREIKNIISQAQDCGARSVILIGGEPLLYPNFRDVVEFIVGSNMSVSLFSNLILLTDDLAQFLYERNVFITGKLNSLIPYKQDLLARKTGTHKIILDKIELLQKRNFCCLGNPLFALHSVILKDNLSEIPSLFRWMRHRKIIPHLQLLTRCGNPHNISRALSPLEAKTIFNKLLEIDRDEFNYNWTPIPPLIGWQCQQYYCSIYVTNNGTIKPCSSTFTCLGNIRKNHLAEILASSVVKKLRNVREYISEPCRSCTYSETCYGCRADAEAVTGNLFASDQYCWISKNLDESVKIAEENHDSKKKTCQEFR